MVPDQTSPSSSSAAKKAKTLRIIAIVLVVLGIAGGCAIFWGSAGPGSSADLSTADDSKVVQRNIAMNSGRMGLLASDLVTYFQDPGTRAAFIVVAASVTAGICLYFARLLDRDNEE
jgi:uncharacterized membrane protein YuzA (DUF378 family)